MENKAILQKALVEILQERSDTRLHGRKIDEIEVERVRDSTFVDAYQDCFGDYYQTENDYIQAHKQDDQHVAILVADGSDENIGVSHPHSDLPHLIGLYVREPYRSKGIASELVHGFMQTVDHDWCVVGCADRVKPFYEQLDCKVIYLEQFKS